jgi:Domain of Unknown Function (DUF748)
VIKTKTKKWIRGLLTLYLAYLAITALLILPALNIATPWAVEHYTGRVLQRDIVVFDPFSLSLSIRGAQLLEANGDTFVSFDKASVNFSLQSLFQQGIVLDQFTLEGLYAQVVRLPSGEFNFSDMIPPEAEQAPTNPEGTAMIGLTISQLTLDSNRIKFTDLQRQQPFTTHWDDLQVSVTGISTVKEDGKPYLVKLQDEAGGSLTWEGWVSVPASSSEGRLQLSGVQLQPAWRFMQPWLAFELTSGHLDTAADYRLNWADDLSYRISNASLNLSNIAVTPQDSALVDTHLAVKDLAVTGIEIDGDSSKLDIAALTISGVDVAAYQQGDQISLVDLFEVQLPEPTDEEPAEESTRDDWRLSLTQFTLTESGIHWRSEFTEPSRLHIQPIEVLASNLAWPASDYSAMSLSLAVNEIATLSLQGELNIGSGDGSIDYKLQNLPIPWFAPNIPPAFKAQLTSGELAAAGAVQLGEFQPVHVTSSGATTDVSGVISGEEESLTRWDSIAWQQLSIDMPSQQIRLAELAVNGYSGRLHIYEDGTINTQRVLEEELAAVEEELEPIQDNASAWQFELPIITVDNSQLDFMDESMPIVFRTMIGDLNGTISGLDTDPASTTTVDLKGSVDGYAPVTFAGTAQPFGEPLGLDLALAFSGLDLVRLTPYSGTYAGYAIDRGTLNLQVSYSLENHRLQGDNSLVIDQLKLGEKVDSDKAMDLPLNLAIALLSDANGVIDLNVPVSGDIDNPEFSLGSVIAGAFVNLITKAATAPFKLLASLVGSEEDLQRVTMAAGQSEVDEAGQGKLLQLGEAMAQRPQLKLVLSGRINPDSDHQYLQDMAVKESLLADGLSAESIKRRDSDWASAVNKRYTQLPAAQTEQLPAARDQYKLLVDSIEVDTGQLKKLGEERAVNVKRYLVNEAGVAADRAVIEQVNPDAAENTFGGVELGVDS